MTPRNDTQPYSNILNELIVHVVGTRKYIRPLQGSQCKIEQVTPKICRVQVFYRGNLLVLLVKRNQLTVEKVVEDPKRRRNFDLYLGRKRILQDARAGMTFPESKAPFFLSPPEAVAASAPPKITWKYKPRAIGILGTWKATGLGVDTKILRECLSNYSVYIFAMNKNVDDWPEENVVFSGLDRSALTPDIILDWVKTHEISKVFILEPVKQQIWRVVEALKEKGVTVYGIPNIEITRKNEIEEHKLFDTILCKTMTTYTILKNEGLTNLSYVGWGVNTKLLRPLGEIRDYTTEVLLFHNAGWGGDTFRKNTEAVVKAFNIASQVMPTLKLHIHTQRRWSQYPQVVQKLAKTNKAITITEGTRPYEEIVRMTQRAHVALLPSKYEGGGLPFYEALACGVPVITVDAPPMNEIVIDGFNGLVCKTSFEWLPNNPSPLLQSAIIDVRDFAEKIVKLASDTNLIKRMSLNARKDMLQNHSLPLFRERLKATLPKTLVFIADYFYPLKGGAEHSIYNFLKNALKHNCKCHVLCFKGFPRLSVARKEIKLDGIHVTQASNSEVIEDYLADKQPDLVMTQLLKAGTVVSKAKKLGIPTVLFIRSFSEHICGGHTIWCRRDLLTCSQTCQGWRKMREINKKLFSDVDLIVSNSDYSRKVVKRFFNRESIIIYPSVNENFRSVEADREGYILFLKPNPLKGSGIILELARRLPAEKFVICGEGKNNVFAKESNVTCLGKREDMAEVYAGAKLVLVPSQAPEGFGRVPVEAMACGVPVIASDLGGLKESCEAGILVKDYWDFPEWVKAVKEALSNREVLVKSQQLFIEKFFRRQRRQVPLLLRLMGLKYDEGKN